MITQLVSAILLQIVIYHEHLAALLLLISTQEATLRYQAQKQRRGDYQWEILIEASKVSKTAVFIECYSVNIC